MNIGIIGQGLIGGSLGLSLKKKNWDGQIAGYDINGQNTDKSLSLGLIDKKYDTLRELVENVALVVVSVPVKKIPEVIKEVNSISQSVIITDVGSVKNYVVNKIKQYSIDNYIPGHPIAGTENSGPEAAVEGLFENKRIILCKKSESVEKMWETVGGKIEYMDCKRHDEIFAAVSHLPHFIAYSLVDAVVELEEEKDAFFKYIASGFRDFTRIASSDPVMWSDIFTANKEQLLEVLEYFKRSVNKLENAIKEGDYQNIKNTLREAKTARDKAIKEMSR